MRPIPAQLVGGPRHGEQLYVHDRWGFEVLIPRPLTVRDFDNPAAEHFDRGWYVARLAGSHELAHLSNGMVPFDWDGPEGETWPKGYRR